jgi:hypothetical protein
MGTKTRAGIVAGSAKFKTSRPKIGTGGQQPIEYKSGRAERRALKAVERKEKAAGKGVSA